LLSTILVVLLVLILIGGVGYRYPAWGAAGPGYPDAVGVLVFVLVIVLVIYLLRGVL
jgi:cbb3-type cytochrome oxidase subunit 3